MYFTGDIDIDRQKYRKESMGYKQFVFFFVFFFVGEEWHVCQDVMMKLSLESLS